MNSMPRWNKILPPTVCATHMVANDRKMREAATILGCPKAHVPREKTEAQRWAGLLMECRELATRRV